MTRPQGLEIDFDVKAGYVSYSAGTVAETREVWEQGTVAADLDAEGTVAGIEVLDLDAETLSHARRYAHEHDLLFPTLVDLAS